MSVSDDLKGATDASVDFAHTEAVSKLGSQQALALASDSRGTAIMAAATGLAAAAAALAASNLGAAGSKPLFGGALATTVIALGAAASALVAVRPVDFYSVGWRPAKLVENLQEAGGDLKALKASTTGFLNDRIESNERVIQRNALWTQAALIALAAAPLIGFIFAAVVKR